MLVKITNIGVDQLHIPAYGKVLEPGQYVETRRSMADVSGDESLKALVVSGDVSLEFTKEANDDVVAGFGEPPAAYSDASRPAAGDVPAFTFIWNTDDNAPNWSDGAAWRDAAGLVT